MIIADSIGGNITKTTLTEGHSIISLAYGVANRLPPMVIEKENIAAELATWQQGDKRRKDKCQI